MEWLARDLTLALRGLRRRPGLTFAALVSLATGLGAALAIYRIVSAAFILPLGVGEPSSIVSIYGARNQRPDDYLPISWLNFEDLSREQTSFAAFAAYQWQRTTLGDAGEARRLYMQFVSKGYFRALGVEPALGRLWSDAEDGRGAGIGVAALSHDFWQHQLGGRPDVLGATVAVGGLPLTVVAVMPRGFKGTRTFTRAELWVPMGMYTALSPYAEDLDERGAQMFDLVGKLRPGISIAQAQGELRALADQLAREYPETNQDQGVRLVPLTSASIEPWQRPLFVRAALLLSSVVGLLLLIACSNVASLLLASGLERRRADSLRLSLGASRGELIRQRLVESLLLSSVGGALGLLLGIEAPTWLWRFRPLELFSADVLDFSLDGRVLLMALLLSIGCGLLFGLLPALKSSAPRMSQALKEGAPELELGGRRFAWRDVLVVSQVALCFIALAGAGLFIKSLALASRVDPGFAADQLLVVSYGASRGTAVEREVLNRQVLAGLGALPGVEKAAQASYQPLTAGPPVYWRVVDQAQTTEEGRRPRLVMTNAVTPSYFDTMGISVLDGRGFSDGDGARAPKVAVVNEVMAKRLWPDVNPLGRQLRVTENGSLLSVVGVVSASKHHSLTESPRWGLYLPFAQWPRTDVTVHLRTSGRPENLVEAVRSRLQSIAPDVTAFDLRPMRQTIDSSLWALRLGAAVLGLLALLALILAVTGVFAVLSYSVRERAREMGIRLALGAQPAKVLRLVLERAMSVVAVGMALGAGLFFVFGRFVGSLLFGIEATDATTLLEIALLLGTVALAAGYWSARPAARVDPAETLRLQ